MSDTNNTPAAKTPEEKELEAVTLAATQNAANLPPEFGGDPAKFIESWKNLRADHTRKSQELAELKKKSSEPPSSEKPVVETPEDKNETPPETLRIPDEKPKPEVTIDEAAIEKEIWETGSLSDATKTAMESKGIPKGVISKLEQAEQAKIVGQAQAAAELVGGMEELKADIEWASTLPPAEKEAINAALKTPLWKDIVNSVHARRIAATTPNRGNEPRPTKGVVNTNTPADTSSMFSSIEQQSEAIRDPRYYSDPTYRKAVEEKIRRTMTSRTVTVPQR